MKSDAGTCRATKFRLLPAVTALKELEKTFARGLGNVVVPKPASEIINGYDRINIVENLGIDWK